MEFHSNHEKNQEGNKETKSCGLYFLHNLLNEISKKEILLKASFINDKKSYLLYKLNEENKKEAEPQLIPYFFHQQVVASSQDFIGLVIDSHYHPYSLILKDKTSLFQRVFALPNSIEKQLLLGYCYEQGDAGVVKDISKAFACFLKAAESNDARAQNIISYYYGTGAEGIAIDYQKSFYYASLSAQQNYAVGLFNLGHCYEHGTGTIRNESKAFALYYQAAMQGYSKAMEKVGTYLFYGTVIKKDITSACYWFQRAALNGMENSYLYAAYCMLDNDMKVHDINTAIELLKHASFKGIKEADLELGKIYYQSTEITPNVLLALDYFSHAYQEGILEAGKYIVEISEKDVNNEELLKKAYNILKDFLKKEIGQKDFDEELYGFGAYHMGLWLKNGWLVKKNEEEALRYLSLAERLGNYDASYEASILYEKKFDYDAMMNSLNQALKGSKETIKKAYYQLGKLNLEGKIIKKDIDTAFRFLDLSFKMGYSEAAYLLAEAYEISDGKHIPNFKKAFEMYSHAAYRCDNARAYYKMAEALYYGLGVTPNDEQAKNMLLESQKRGVEEADILLGMMYLEGKVYQKDEEKAFSCFKNAYEHHILSAPYYLSHFYLNGIVVEQDITYGLALLKEAEENRFYLASHVLGQIDLEGKYVTKNEESAFNHFLLGATYYDEACTLDIVKCYQNGVGVEKNEEIAFSYLYQYHFHKSQSVLVMYEIVLCYLKGRGVKKDIVKASYLLNAMIDSKQKEVDISEAEFLLGYAYYTGSMTLRNPPAAFYQFSLAAQNEHIEAMFYLAECYDKGTGISVNHEKAVSWYIKAAEKKHLGAMYELGNHYYDGIGIEQDYQKAFSYYKMAAESGYLSAQVSLAGCYANGVGTMQSYALAAKYYALASQKNHALAEFHLADLYENGFGVTLSYDLAIEYYKRAIEHGYSLAKESLERVEKKLELKRLQEVGVEPSHVFISWNHYSEELSIQISEILKQGNLKVWHSNASCEGFISETCLLAIKNAKTFLVLLSLKAIKSAYVQMEVQAIYDRVKNGEIDISCIKAMYDGPENEIRQALSELPKEHPMRIFIDFDLSPLYVTEPQYMIDNIINSLTTGAFKTYRNVRHRKTAMFSMFILNTFNFDRYANMVDLTSNIEKGYISRKLALYTKKDESVFYSEEDLLKNELSLIVAPGGRGKSVYLQNLEHRFFSQDNASTIFFRFPLTQLKNYVAKLSKEVDAEDFIAFLKEEVFQKELDEVEKNIPFRNEKFIQLFLQENKQIYFLLDAMDELGNDRKKWLQIFEKMWSDFVLKYNKNKSTHFIFTSRIVEKIHIAELSSLMIFTLPSFNEKEQRELFVSIMNLFNASQLRDMANHQEEVTLFSEEEDYPLFQKEVAELHIPITSNPLILCNFLILYFMNALENRPMPKTEYEIMMQSIHLLIDQLEDEKRIDLDLNLVSASFLNQHLRNILAYLYFEILAFDSRPIEDIILEYLQDNEKEEEIQKLTMLERKRLALALKQHFISRNFAGEGNIVHALFATYFASEYCYQDLIQITGKGKLAHLTFKDEKAKERLLSYQEQYFSLGENWIDVLNHLISKMLYQLFLLPHEENLSKDNFKFLQEVFEILYVRNINENMKKSYRDIRKMAKEKRCYFASDVLQLLTLEKFSSEENN